MKKTITLIRDDRHNCWEKIKSKLNSLSLTYNFSLKFFEDKFFLEISRTGINGNLYLIEIHENEIKKLKIEISIDYSWFIPNLLRSKIENEIEKNIIQINNI